MTIPARDVRTTVLGYPRIGPRRELKRATERYWSGSIDAAELEAVANRRTERRVVCAN